MYFQGFGYSENFGLVVLLFLTCKSSNKLRDKSKSILDLSKDEQGGIYCSRNSASSSSDISTHGKTVHVSEEVPSTSRTHSYNLRHKRKKPQKSEGKKRLINTSEFDGSYSPHNTKDISYSKDINPRSKISLVPKNSSKIKVKSLEDALEPLYVNFFLEEMPILLQNQGISELENILKSEALVDDVLQPGYYEKYFSVFSTLNDIKEKYIEFSQKKIQKCERIFSKILQDINILVKKSNILSKVPSLVYLIKHANQFIRTDIIYTSDKSHIRVLFALKLVKSIITKSEYEIDRILDSFTSTNINNIDFDIEMKTNLVLYTSLTFIIKIIQEVFSNASEVFKKHLELFSAAKKWLEDIFAKTSCASENIFSNKDNSYLLDIMFRFDESDINEIYTLLQEDKNNGTGTSNIDNHLESSSRKLSDHFISKIICYYFQSFDAKYGKRYNKLSTLKILAEKFIKLKSRFYAFAQRYHTNKPIENDSFHGIFKDTYEFFHEFVSFRKIIEN